MNKKLPSTIDKDSILKLVDYLLLNAYSLKLKGLYHGKMGLSVCLFELARHLGKEEWEEHAFELLLESVANVGNNISFENGLSGIGYTLFYLQSHKFIEIDMDEIWEEKSQKIESHFKSEMLKKYKTQWSLLIYYFLFLASNKESKTDISTYLDYLLDEFSMSFKVIANSPSHTIIKMNISRDFSAFLKFINCIDTVTDIPYNYNKMQAACRQYADLYQSKIMACSYEAGYFMELLADRFNDQQLKSSAIFQGQRALSATHCSAMTLKQKLDLLFLLLKDVDKNRQYIIEIEDSIFRSENKTLEQSLFNNLGMNNLYYSYYNGISRLLLYLVVRDLVCENKDFSRFNYLFI